MTNLGRLTPEKKIESEKACTWALLFKKQKWTCWISACIVRRPFQSHSCPSDRNGNQHSWTGASLHSCTTEHTPCTAYAFLEKAKHSRITCNGAVWELTVTSLLCWLSCHSLLPHKLSELLSWIRNLRKTRIHSTPKFFCSRFQYEIRKNEHRREFSQMKYINRYFDHLAIFPNLIRKTPIFLLKVCFVFVFMFIELLFAV